MDSLDDFEDYTKMDQDMLNETLRESARQGDLDAVIELLTSPDLPQKANIHYENEWSLLLAIKNGHSDVVKYLLMSEDLNEHADITANDYNVFKALCHALNTSSALSSSNMKSYHEEILSFVIYEYKMPINEYISTWLSTNAPHIKDMLDKRDLTLSLQKDLSINPSYFNKVKV